MRTQVRVRPAVAEDLDALVALLADLFAIETDFRVDEERQRRGLAMMLDANDGRCLMVAEIPVKVVAMASAQALVSTAEGALAAVVEDVVVSKAWRAAGIGTRLLEALEAWARKRGITRLQLLADRDNAPALGFYASRGWRSTRLTCLRKLL
jgi:GNAT superfamily N-acetyltransferase